MSKNLQTVTVAIGRHVGDKPMDRDTWDEYREEVDYTIKAYFGEESVVFHGLGGGVYDGKKEESAVWIMLNTLVPIVYSQFLHRLALLAGRYHQESIAVTRGVSILLEAR